MPAPPFVSANTGGPDATWGAGGGVFAAGERRRFADVLTACGDGFSGEVTPFRKSLPLSAASIVV